ncbi:hypothetical protein QU38_02020, partial [Staphylococcus aureus]
ALHWFVGQHREAVGMEIGCGCRALVVRAWESRVGVDEVEAPVPLVDRHGAGLRAGLDVAEQAIAVGPILLDHGQARIAAVGGDDAVALLVHRHSVDTVADRDLRQLPAGIGVERDEHRLVTAAADQHPIGAGLILHRYHLDAVYLPACLFLERFG